MHIILLVGVWECSAHHLVGRGVGVYLACSSTSPCIAGWRRRLSIVGGGEASSSVVAGVVALVIRVMRYGSHGRNGHKLRMFPPPTTCATPHHKTLSLTAMFILNALRTHARARTHTHIYTLYTILLPSYKHFCRKKKYRPVFHLHPRLLLVLVVSLLNPRVL